MDNPLADHGGDYLAGNSPLAARVAGWAQPDMKIIDGGLRPAPKFPAELLGASLRSIVISLAESKGAPADYIAAAILAFAAGLVGNARHVEAWPGWREPLALWAGLVGLPSAGKSPAIDAPLSIIRELERESAPGFDEKMRRHAAAVEEARLRFNDWKADCETAHEARAPAPMQPADSVPPDEPVPLRICAMDSTIEALAKLLAGNPKGLILYRDELSGLLAERYGNEADRPFYCEAFGGRPFTIDRVKHKSPIFIPNLTLSIVGGIQPDRLASLLLAGDDDGLASRFIFVWPDGLPPRRPSNGYDLEPLRRAFRRLHGLRLIDGENGPEPGVMRLDDLAAAAHQCARERLYEDRRDAAGKIGSHIGKLPGIALRLSALLALLDWALGHEETPPESVRVAEINRAWGFLFAYALPMAERVYGDAAIPLVDRRAKSLALAMLERREERINARTIRLQWALPGLRKAEDVDAALAALIEADWVRPAFVRAGDAPGRRRKDFQVNPLVFGPTDDF